MPSSGRASCPTRSSLSASTPRSSPHGKPASEAITRHGIDPHQLILEVTETVFVGTDGNVVGTLRSIASTGCTIALDDFGTGYSSLNQLRLIELVAEGIETATHAEIAATMGIPLGQGYHLDRPMSADSFFSELRSPPRDDDRG